MRARRGCVGSWACACLRADLMVGMGAAREMISEGARYDKRERDRGERKSGVAAASGARRSIHTCFRRRGSIGARGTLPATSGAHGNGDAAVWLVQASMLARDGGVLVVRVRAAPPCAGESTGVDAFIVPLTPPNLGTSSFFYFPKRTFEIQCQVFHQKTSKSCLGRWCQKV